LAIAVVLRRYSPIGDFDLLRWLPIEGDGAIGVSPHTSVGFPRHWRPPRGFT